MKTLIGVLFSLLFTIATFGQSTTVSGTVTDSPDGQAWFGGTYSFVFRVNPANPVGPYFWNGAPFSTSQTIAGNLDASGHYSTSVPSNTAITPAGSSWDVTFCPLATAQCVTYQSTTVTGATQTFAPSPASIRINLAVPLQNPRAYADAEVVNGALGQTYYNIASLSTGSIRVCLVVPCGWASSAIGAVVPPNLGGTGTGSPTAHGTAVGEGPSTPFNFVLPTNNGQCYMSAPSNFATTDPFFQTCPSGGGGGGSSAGPQGTVQEAGSVAGSFAVSPFLDIGGTGADVQASSALETKGPNPMVDVTLFGAVPYQLNLGAPGIPGVTANCISGNTSVAITGAGSTRFVNGEGVTLYNCGPAHSMSTPSAPTMAPAVAVADTSTGFVATNTNAGSSTRCIKIAARDQAQGLTAASPEVCITNGSAVLGGQSVSVTSCARSGQTVTCVTSAHTLPVGCAAGSCGSIQINGTSDDPNFAGWFPLNSVPDTTHITYVGGLLDKNGATASSTGGQFTYYNSDHVTLPAYTAGQWQYGIYEGASGAETLVDVALPNIATLASQPTYNTWDWYGSTYGGGVGLPAFWPNTPPTVATNDSLTTTITAGGGTSTLTLAVAPSNTPGSATTILKDACPNVKAAFAFANSFSGGGGMVEFPAVADNGGNPTYLFNSYCALSGTVSQAMPLTLGDTMQFSGQWYGNRTVNGLVLVAPASSIEGHVPITVRSAKPGIYFTGSRMSGVTLQPVGNSYISILHVNSLTSIFTDDNFSTNSNPAVDYNGIALYDFPPFQLGFGWRMDNVSFQAGPNQTSGASFTPFILSKYNFEINMTNTPMVGRGMFYACPPAGANLSFRMGQEIQGETMPLLSFYHSGSGNCSGWVDLYGTWSDTASEPTAANFDNGFGATIMVRGSNAPSSGRAYFSGAPFNAIVMDGFAGLSGVIGQNVNIHYTEGSTGAVINNTQVVMGHAQSLYVLGGVPAAPTCSVATAGPPFTQAFTTSVFTYAPIFFNGTISTPGTFSLPSNSCTSNGTTQQVTITIPAAIPGAIGYRIDKSTGGGAGGFLFGTVATACLATTSLSNIMTANCGNGESLFPSDGPTALSDQLVKTNFIYDAQYMDMAEIATPANPGTGVDRLSVNSTSHLLTCLTSIGANCMPPGCPPGGLVDAIQYNGGGACAFAGVNSPTVNGNYLVNYNVTAGAAVPPTITLPGVPINPQTGTTYTYLYSDRGSLVTASNTGAQTYTLVNPTNVGFGFNYFNVLDNINTGAVTENASGFTVNGGSSFLTPASWLRWLWSNGVNYTAEAVPTLRAFPNSCTTAITIVSGVFGCGSAGSVSSWSGDGALYNNVNSTGAVTATLATAGANRVWGNCTTSTGTPSYCQITDPMLTAVSHAALFNATNVWTSLQDFSSATWKLPSAAGFTANATSQFGLDTTNKNIHGYINNADAIVASIPSTPTNNDCAKWTVSSGTVQLADAGAPCGSGSGGGGGGLTAPPVPQFAPLVPQLAYSIPSAAVNANISATTMVTFTNAIHHYKLGWTISLTTPGTSCVGSTTVVLNAIFTNPNNSTPVTQNISGTVTIASSGNGTVGFISSGETPIWAAPGTAVQYSTSSFTPGGSCSPAPKYQVQPTLVQEF